MVDFEKTCATYGVSLTTNELNKLKCDSDPSKINFVQISKDFGLHKSSVASMTRNILQKRVSAADVVNVLDDKRYRSMSSF